MAEIIEKEKLPKTRKGSKETSTTYAELCFENMSKKVTILVWPVLNV